MLSQSMEDYLKAIYKLRHADQRVSTNAIAENLGVSPASVTSMLKQLASLELIIHTPYQGAELTDLGTKVALEVIRHHRLIELYLTEFLGYRWDQVHDEAERLEHVISEEMEDRMDQALGRPTSDPHGDPIPSRDLVLPPSDAIMLSELSPGQQASIQRVSDRDSEMLRYLKRLELVPSAQVILIEKSPFSGPLLIQVGSVQHSIGLELASNIYVSNIHDPHAAPGDGAIARAE